MRIKLDENMPTALAELLRGRGHDAETVAEEELSGADDPSVLAAAVRESRILITFDTDFGNIRSFPLGSHAGIVVFRLRDQRWRAMREPAQRLVESGVLERLRGGLAVADEVRIRVRVGMQDDQGASSLD